jgi:hypothetical protein
VLRAPQEGNCFIGHLTLLLEIHSIIIIDRNVHYLRNSNNLP